MSDFARIFSDRSFKLTLLLTFIYLVVGFALLEFGITAYGWVFFVLLPFSLGLVIGSMPVRKWAYLGGAIAIIIFIILLLAGGLEGMVCVLMALPIIIPLVWLGVVLRKYLVKKGVMEPTDNFKSLVWPLLIILFGGPLEKWLDPHETKIVDVRTERIFPYTPEQVYDAIKSVDTLDAAKPFLIKLDLPVPEKCVLEKEAVGGIRTCYFTGGKITEKITELERGRVLKMDVVDYQLTGRKWLGFKEAIYYFEKVGTDSCRMIRITTYTSVLKPRFYWEPLEKMGIQQEHEYVFDNLEKDLRKR